MRKKVERHIVKSEAYRKAIRRLKEKRLKRHDISFYSVIIILVRKLQRDRISEKASSVAFSFTLAIFPAIIVLFTLIPYINTGEIDFTQNVMEFLNENMPESVYEFTSATIEDIISKQRGGLLSIGLISSLFLSSNGMVSLMSAFNSIHRTIEKRGFLKTRLIGLGLTFMLALGLIVATGLLIVAQYVIKILDEMDIIFIDDKTFLIFGILRYVILFVVFLLTIASIYHFAPSMHSKLKFLSPGALFASVSLMLASIGFSFYINNFGTYNKFYGSIGALIAIMVYLYILSIIFLLGFELNASIDKAKHEDYD
ncbi:YihY/virulence factor BrkB family protein [Marinigracilibium pacificum]|uniref:YihY/virulence factor BrkB family protein n=1 Tax=Marinigracilibium pacificum TaxID=2729599 RepID=A0A848J6J3_9BACT|nr:YihY/virulence factor BrkB family protein [Marinigracilibium pacificum]NMM48742.1 YihY/virulence factor BrkB family protein [Marinigracilibium pacificum]